MKKIIKSLLILAISMLCGFYLKNFLGLPIPEMIYGMMVLLILLLTKIVKLEDVRSLSDSLLLIFSFLFIPAGVGLMETYDIISQDIFKVLAILFISFFITAITTGFTVKFLRRISNNGK